MEKYYYDQLSSELKYFFYSDLNQYIAYNYDLYKYDDELKNIYIEILSNIIILINNYINYNCSTYNFKYKEKFIDPIKIYSDNIKISLDKTQIKNNEPIKISSNLILDVKINKKFNFFKCNKLDCICKKDYDYRIIFNNLTRKKFLNDDSENNYIDIKNNIKNFFEENNCIIINDCIDTVRIMLDITNGRCRGFGFIDFKNKESFDIALLLSKKLNNKIINDLNLKKLLLNLNKPIIIKPGNKKN